MKKPLIGILTNIFTIDAVERNYVNRDYVKIILKSGGIPILLPIIDDFEALKRQVEVVDALVLSGGQDVHPSHYGEEPSPLLGTVCSERDHYEIDVIKYAHRLRKPMLGVCRGLQLLNVVFGGSLHQDIGNDYPASLLKHLQKERREEATHDVDVLTGSRLFAIVQKERLVTNSFHHQAVKKPAPGFQVNARASDGVIEGIEMIGSHFVMGVQWHPEMLGVHHLDTQKLFQAFIQETL